MTPYAIEGAKKGRSKAATIETIGEDGEIVESGGESEQEEKPDAMIKVRSHKKDCNCSVVDDM